MSQNLIFATDNKKNKQDSSPKSWNFRAYAGQSCRWLSQKTKKLWLFWFLGGGRGLNKAPPCTRRQKIFWKKAHFLNFYKLTDGWYYTGWKLTGGRALFWPPLPEIKKAITFLFFEIATCNFDLRTRGNFNFFGSYPAYFFIFGSENGN